MVSSNTGEAAAGLGFWLQWQVLVSALIFVLPAATAIVLLRKRGASGGDPVKPANLWAPCWRNLHPRWLLLYRAFAFVAMAFLLYQIVAAFGFFVFFFYTQWTFALVVVYFALATIVSIRGCRIHARKPLAQAGERDNFLKDDSDEKENKLKSYHNPTPNEQLGFLGKLLQMVYLTCGGAVMLTDIVFWGLLLPFMAGENFQLTLLIGCMHSVNAVFLIIESALNCMPFTWFGLIYFVLFSCIYGAFQWILHACCLTWWPYPFLDLSTPWAPLWYLALVLVHIPCYGLFVLLTKAKDAAFSKMFPLSFVRIPKEGE
ncbi:hypothetical protein CDL12_02702 [Handroanthus impetiginosus]|uniref:Uncharacterized protein n=1 Tax=Handroanthus impetiginosus TaxID=429701 RepID=A0A2G9I459_9LAMI|nr:hypothetical protein CDL12_02702 [Handroanthus impetiginosus]